ncbi:MAG: hypothetical protein P9F19_01605 [Candidatus Contendobacter sp.]|nr:hypothetical protein [Candidatus Contendobacter sp.]MDG4556085.1 hypothetical protein [Candidatus Contendobacter sp.]
MGRLAERQQSNRQQCKNPDADFEKGVMPARLATSFVHRLQLQLADFTHTAITTQRRDKFNYNRLALSSGKYISPKWTDKYQK